MEDSSNRKDEYKTGTQIQNKNSSMYCVKWNGFANQIKEGLASLYGTEELVDVTLASPDGQKIRAHKIVLAMSSPFFQKILKENPCKHPIVIISGIKFRQVEHVIRFIYMGEVRMREDEIEDFIDAAESLKIDGISTVNQFDAEGVPRSERRVKSALAMTNNMCSSSSFRTGVIKRVETVSSSSRMSPPFKRIESSSETSTLEERNDNNNSHKMKLPRRSEISPLISPAGRPNSLPSSISTPPFPWSHSSSSSAPVGSHWSLCHTQSQSQFHKPIMDVFDLRTDSSNSGGSPGVIVGPKDKDEAANLSLARGGDFPLELITSRSRSEGDANSARSDKREGRQRFKSDDRAYELSMPDFSTIMAAETLAGRHSGGMTSPMYSSRSIHQFPPQKIWPDFASFPILRTPHYLPLSLVGSSPMISSQPLSRFHPVLPSISMSVNLTTSAQLSRYGPSSIGISPPQSSPINTSSGSNEIHNHHHGHGHYHAQASSSSSSSSSKQQPSALRAKFTASMFAHGTPPHFLRSSSRSGLNILSSKPRSRTTTIRSSQVPQSARYTAVEVDAMVEKVDNYPGPLVPCTVCQKFVKRERLRAHIHECHLLQGESIICPHCGIGLKSKGSFRVHIWRHKKGNLGVKKLRDKNLPS